MVTVKHSILDTEILINLFIVYNTLRVHCCYVEMKTEWSVHFFPSVWWYAAPGRAAPGRAAATFLAMRLLRGATLNGMAQGPPMATSQEGGIASEMCRCRFGSVLGLP